MRYLNILGEKKRIPPYPHHKDYVYRCRHFFKANHLFGLLLLNGVYRMLRRKWMQYRKNYAIPLCLLIDPTSACNLDCTGCWAADYDRSSRLSYEKLDEIITDARKLGVIEIMFSGGEPMMRKDDILNLCRKHHQLTFGMYTNGTLIDESFADEMARLGNLNVFISIEGFKEKTDFRRGAGTFDKVIAAMDILKKRDIGFGFSICYHSKNCEEVCSDEFLDFLREKGAWVGWMFLYMPIGEKADLSLCLNPDQRAMVKATAEAYMTKHDFTLIDFANMGHKAFGCVGAGNEFVHINANGDLEPCAFFHYSDVNIKDMPLAEALKSPFFKHFRNQKPFSDNPFQPCPIMDKPSALHELSKSKGMHSTHLESSEEMHQLAEKTKLQAEKWEPIADQMHHEISKKEMAKINKFRKHLLYKDSE